MKISVMMPTYECPPDLMAKSLTSVLDQSHKDVEIIVKDGSLERRAIDDPFIRSLFCHYQDKIVYVNAPETPPKDQLGYFGHNGFYEALNYCVKASTGDILCMLSSDDELAAKDTLEYVNKHFEPYKYEPTVLYGRCDWIDRNGVYFDSKKPPEKVTFESLLKDYTLYTPAIFWNKAVHTSFGYFNEKLAWCADMDFWLRCWRWINTNQTTRTLGRYRVWGTSQARSNTGALRDQGLAIQKLHGAQ